MNAEDQIEEDDELLEEEGTDEFEAEVDDDIVERQPRRHATVSNSDRDRIIKAADRGDDFVELARQLGVKRSTAYTIVRSGRAQKLPKGGAKRFKWDGEMQAHVLGLIQANPLITLKEMNANLRQQLPEKPHVTEKTISVKLDGALYTTKLARDLPADRNSPRVIESRREFCEWLCSVDVVSGYKIFIDEFGFNTWMRRSIGRSRRGERVYRQVATQKGLRVTVCLAICPGVGVVHYQIYDKGMTKEKFGEFLQITVGNFQAAFPVSRCYVVIDNVSSHNDAEDFEIPATIQIKRLPPYSPFLTPVENSISCWKAALKRELAADQQKFIAPTAEQRGNQSMAAYRRDILYNMVDRTIGCISADKCTEWFNHVFTYVPRCLGGQAIDG